MKKMLGIAGLALALSGCNMTPRCVGEGTVVAKGWYYDWDWEFFRSEYTVRTSCGDAIYRPGLFERNPAIGVRLNGVVYGGYFEKQ
jgi:hypothetical protein